MKKKMTPKRAAEIINDIHEGMCRASRAELMECASYYSLRSSYLYADVMHSYGEAATHALQEMRGFQEKWEKEYESDPNSS